MTDEILSEILDRSVEHVPVSAPPVGEILRVGAAIQRRRRRTTSAAVVLAAVALIGGMALNRDDAQPGADIMDGPTGLPVPPAGWKWVGVARTVVAVPQSWPVIGGIYCPGPTTPFATITQWHVTTGCMPILDPQQPPMSVDIQGTSSGRFAATLQQGPGGPGDLTQDSLDATRTTLPEGWLAVPSGEPYGGAGSPSVTSEVAALEAAGFKVVVTADESGKPWARVTTDPEIGTPALAGSTVVVHDHGAVPSTATLKGRLTWAGGLPLRGPNPHSGTIHVVNANDTVDETAQAHEDGTWTMLVPPGRYEVHATSPGFGSQTGDYDACDGPARVRVGAHETLTVDVYCQMR